MSFLSVILPTHNPRRDYLDRVLNGLRGQTLEPGGWELVIVDNGSKPPLKAAAGQQDHTTTGQAVASEIDLGWHAHARVVSEKRLGLTCARLRGFAEARGELIVMVDDDNVLAPDYLATAVRIARERPGLGAFGGKVVPIFESPPPPWLARVTSGLGLQDLGDTEIRFPEHQAGPEAPRRVANFPRCAPIGAGMVLRREVAAAYTDRLRRSGVMISDRRGESLSSGGDNDICLTALESGWQVGYAPDLRLDHLIPPARMTLAYQQRMARESMKSFIIMLDQHGIRPWAAIPAWSVAPRVVRDLLRVKPWRDEASSLCWWMNRGRYEACAQLRPRPDGNQAINP